MKRLGFFLMTMLLFTGVQLTNAGIDVDSLKQEIIANSEEIHEQQKDSVMFSKFSADQIIELKREENEVRQQEIDGQRGIPLNGLEIVIIVLLPFLFVVLIISLNVRAKNAESKRKYDLYTKSLEMGQTVPEHFFDKPKKANPSSNLKKGILALSVGIALIIYFTIVHNDSSLIAGIVPSFVGIGYLLVHFLEKPKTDSTVNNNEQHG